MINPSINLSQQSLDDENFKLWLPQSELANWDLQQNWPFSMGVEKSPGHFGKANGIVSDGIVMPSNSMIRFVSGLTKFGSRVVPTMTFCLIAAPPLTKARRKMRSKRMTFLIDLRGWTDQLTEANPICIHGQEYKKTHSRGRQCD